MISAFRLSISNGKCVPNRKLSIIPFKLEFKQEEEEATKIYDDNGITQFLKNIFQCKHTNANDYGNFILVSPSFAAKDDEEEKKNILFKPFDYWHQWMAYFLAIFQFIQMIFFFRFIHAVLFIAFRHHTHNIILKWIDICVLLGDIFSGQFAIQQRVCIIGF